MLLHFCGGGVYWLQDISLPTQSVVVGTVGLCVGVCGVGQESDYVMDVLLTLSVATGERV